MEEKLFALPCIEIHVQLMYNDTYLPEEEAVADVLATAEKYGLERLKAMCEKSLADYVSKENALEILMLSKQFSLVSLKNKVVDFLKTCDSNDVEL